MTRLRLMFVLSILLPVCLSSPLLFFGATEPEERVTKATDPKYRIPVQENIEITEYEIKLTPHFTGENAFTFDGHVKIKAKVIAATSKLTLHAKNLKFEKLTYLEVEVPAMQEIDIPNINSIQMPYDFWDIDFPTPIAPGKDVEINIIYKGVLGDDMRGFYKSSYMEGPNTKWMGTTQFQPVHARRAFPCMDEPHFKAKYTITIRRPTEFQPSLSNTKIEKSDVVNGMTEDVFKQTPSMSSYLVAFIVSEYEAASKTEPPNEHFAIWARPEASSQGNYALETSQNIVKKLGEILKFPFADMSENLKNDHVSIPDFSAGAMENWGLATYREAYLMANKETSVRYYQQIAAILAHEIAHFWFGDLVTCDWWSQTWLNEGFARYFQYYLTDEVEKMDMITQFNVAQIHTVMLIDATERSLPMSNIDTNSPAEVQAQFGSVTYNKGAAVIRMMKEWIGKTTFEKALANYMATNKFMTVTEEKLFKEFQDAAIEDNTISVDDSVATVMSSWTQKNGFPVVDVAVDRNTGTVTISQKQFLKEGEAETTKLWHIPLTYTTKTAMDFDNLKPKIFSVKTQALPDKINTDDWIMVNLQQIGYYRVNYDVENWKMLSEALSGSNRTKINTHNRAQYVDDLFNFARENIVEYNTMLEFTQFLEMESDYAPWSAAFAGFSFMRLRFQSLPNLLAFINRHTLAMMSKTLITDLGLVEKDDDTHLKKLFRMNALSLACQLGHEDCIKQSTTLFDEYKKNPTTASINPNLREHVYCNALRHGNGEDFDVLWNKYVHENVINEKVVIMNALGCTTQHDKLNTLLYQLVVQNSPIRDQDKMAVFNSAINGNMQNIEAVYNFVSLNIPIIQKVFGSDNLKSMFSTMAVRMTKSQLDEFKVMLENNIYLIDSEKDSGLASIVSAEKDMAWAKERETKINDWLKLKYNSAGALTVSLTLMLTMLASLFLNR